MEVDVNYNDNVEQQNTHLDLLPQEAQEYAILEESRDLLHKAGAIHKMMAATKTSLPKATRKTQAVVAALLLQLMAR